MPPPCAYTCWPRSSGQISPGWMMGMAAEPNGRIAARQNIIPNRSENLGWLDMAFIFFFRTGPSACFMVSFLAGIRRGDQSLRPAPAAAIRRSPADSPAGSPLKFFRRATAGARDKVAAGTGGGHRPNPTQEWPGRQGCARLPTNCAHIPKKSLITAATRWICASVNSGNIGRLKHSRPAFSAFGKSPARYPRLA